QAEEKLHECGLSRSGRADERNGLPALRLERDVGKRWRIRRAMLEGYVIERETGERADLHGMRRTRVGRYCEYRFEIRHRRFGLAVGIDDVPQLLQRSEYEERVDEQREELADGYLLCEDEVQHQEQDGRSQQIHTRSLNEAEAAEIAHLLQLELEDLLGRRIQARNLLLRETEALDQRDFPHRFRRRAGERRRLRDDHLLHALDSTAQHRAEQAEQRNREQKRRRDRPVNLVCVYHHEHDTND